MSNFSFLQKTAVVAGAILVVTGCTTESSTDGCNVTPSGFTGTAKSELGEGSFDYSDQRYAAYEAPAAVAERGEFELSYKRFSDDSTPLALRSAAPDKLVDLGGADGATSASFRAVVPGVVAVLAVSTSDANQVVDLLHVRVLTPSKIRIAPAYDFIDVDLSGLEKGSLIVHEGDRSSFVADVLGEVDEAHGALGEHPVGELVELGGLAPKWETSDAEIVALEPDKKGIVEAWAKNAGTATVTVSAGDVSKVVRVTVKAGVR